ncbi:uncharacterized protein METZ01_LOCUS23743 [marine metagenome]|uniref:Uncharacterized protein n=1 Tax=marine metagenome TaxID=408172 RepID=A0A381PY37_9ZZZZ
MFRVVAPALSRFESCRAQRGRSHNT